VEGGRLRTHPSSSCRVSPHSSQVTVHLWRGVIVAASASSPSTLSSLGESAITSRQARDGCGRTWPQSPTSESPSCPPQSAHADHAVQTSASLPACPRRFVVVGCSARVSSDRHCREHITTSRFFGGKPSQGQAAVFALPPTSSLNTPRNPACHGIRVAWRVPQANCDESRHNRLFLSKLARTVALAQCHPSVVGSPVKV
jgi:hypothetical protein